jgi:hypothetical protein
MKLAKRPMAYSLMFCWKNLAKEVIDLVEQYLVASPDLIVDVRNMDTRSSGRLLETDSC